MKFLKNKGIVLILALFAVGLVFKNLVWPSLRRHSPAPARAAANAPSASPLVAAATAKASPAPAAGPVKAAGISVVGTMNDRLPQSPMDLNAMQSSAPAWAETPRRDPFHIRGGIKDGKSARELLTLMGVLRQTRSTLAVVNNQVLSVGDSILGFKVESVEDDRVWVSGPNGREVVDFKYTASPAMPKPRASAPPNLSLAPH